MNVTLNRVNADYLLEAKGGNDISVMIDNKSGEQVQGASPMELLLMAVGGCNAIDIISILKKQRQPIDGYKVEVAGTRRELHQAKPFEKIHVKVFLEGEIDPSKALRAAKLSFEKYCSVSMTMDQCVAITHEIILNQKPIS